MGRKKKQMTYSELVSHVEEQVVRMSRWDVVCWLIGFQGAIGKEDLENIRKLYVDGFVD